MAIRFDRILEGFDGPFEKLADVVRPPAGRVTEAPAGGGYLLSHQINDAFVAVNRLLKANEDVQWLKEPVTVGGRTHPAGTMFVPAKATTLPILQRLAADRGLSFDPVASRPPGEVVRLRPVRIGLWDVYGGSMPSGWTRWLLEQFEFPFEVVFAKTLDGGNLASRFDVLIFVDGAIPSRDTASNQPEASSIPSEFRDWLGTVSVAKTVPELKKFVEAGGTLLTIGSSTAMAHHLGLPLRNALTERVGGGEAPLPSEKFYVPGSILQARVDNSHPLAYGLDQTVDVFFDHSEAFRLLPEAASRGIRAIAWFDSPTPLRSGWAWGQHYLDQAVQIIDAPVGKGRLILFGPEIVWRGQPHGTFKFLFNGIYYANRS
jgi:hypothetical protein